VAWSSPIDLGTQDLEAPPLEPAEDGLSNSATAGHKTGSVYYTGLPDKVHTAGNQLAAF